MFHSPPKTRSQTTKKCLKADLGGLDLNNNTSDVDNLSHNASCKKSQTTVPIEKNLNTTFDLETTKDSFMEQLLHIPGRIEKIITSTEHEKVESSCKSCKSFVDDKLFDKLKVYLDEKLDEKFNELTEMFTTKFTQFRKEMFDHVSMNVNQNIEAPSQSEVTRKPRRQRNKSQLKDVSIENSVCESLSVKDLDVNLKGKCDYLELENNLCLAVIENIRFKGYISPFNLAKMVFQSIDFPYDDKTLENAKIFTLKNGQKKLTLKFYSKLVRNDFLDLFGSYGYITNFNIGLNNHSRLYLKEKLTRVNRDIYYHARRLLKDGIIEDFSTNSGCIFILPKNMRSFDFKHYIKINCLEDLRKIGGFELPSSN